MPTAIIHKPVDYGAGTAEREFCAAYNKFAVYYRTYAVKVDADDTTTTHAADMDAVAAIVLVKDLNINYPTSP